MVVVFGTRPEAIKLQPVVRELNAARYKVTLVNTGQHQSLLTDAGIDLDKVINLSVLGESRFLSDVYSKSIGLLSEQLRRLRPSVVLSHGDTATSLAAALSSFLEQIPVAHVEAGLRTNNLFSPFPEEMNRKLSAVLASYHFAPTEVAKNNLVREGVLEESIFVTGNTVVDSTKFFFDTHLAAPDRVAASVDRLSTHLGWNPIDENYLLMTLHRRENSGSTMVEILRAISDSAKQNPRIRFCFLVHPNPIISDVADKFLGKNENVSLLPPLPYGDFMVLMSRSVGLVTDSGGLQEEAITLGKRVVIARATTERPEVVESGLGVLAGTSYDSVFAAITQLIRDIGREARLPILNLEGNPFGDGFAASRIVSTLGKLLSDSG